MVVHASRIDPVQLPDLHDLDRMPSWPAWVSSRLASIKVVDQKSVKHGRYGNIQTLPHNLLLSPPERAECERYTLAVGTLFAQTPNRAAQWRDETLSVVTWLMLNRASQHQNELGVEATGEAYLVALADVPWWAVKAAAFRWCGGRCGTSSNGGRYEYQWRPDSAVLRAVAMEASWRLREPWLQPIERLLAAEPLIEFDEAHRATMQRRFSELAAELRKLG
ncbi:hypothetical protein [Bradyrhizobium sp. MOS003]|uniref:hypothetical protein n=1 Tax=Bradyrhizobium sp. MOS003 TaxID=2133946 RepID=UPI000D1395BA|nr:hypothetical protein [Bradyrhizobium sp. MOS003]PSO19496.1 hypothetical protein C7G42_14675 [Bradyrhizobium sp. MOS003]